MDKNARQHTNSATQAQFGYYTTSHPKNIYNGDHHASNPPSQSPRFGLIRGYHRQMYKPARLQSGTCCGCNDPHSNTGPAVMCECCNCGVVCGCVLLGVGLIAILTGFMLPQKGWTWRRLSHKEIDELNRIKNFIDFLVIFGLTILAVGGLVVSFSLLWPFLRPKRDYNEDPVSALIGSDVYVKAEKKPAANSETGSYLSLGFHREFEAGDVSLQRVQPHAERKGPIDLPAMHGR